MSYSLGGRAVEIIETEWELDEGAYVIDACWVDSGLPLTEAECEHLSELYGAELYQDGYVDRAAAAYDRAKDMWKYGE